MKNQRYYRSILIVLVFVTALTLLPAQLVAASDFQQEVPTCSTGHAVSVVNYSPGLNNKSDPVVASRSDAGRALGAPQGGDARDSFVSLGYGGSITLELGGYAVPTDGPDLQLFETSYGNPSFSKYPEQATVEVAANLGEWYPVGTAQLDSSFELPGALEYVRYVRVTDTSNPSDFGKSSTSDGYDVDGIIVCVADAMTPLKLTSMCSDDPDVSRRWRVRNPNPYAVAVSWDVYGTGQSGSYIANPGDTYFETQTVGGPNTTKIYWEDYFGKEYDTVKASGGADCNPDPECHLTFEGKSASESWHSSVDHLKPFNGLTDTVYVSLHNISEPVTYRWEMFFPTDRSGEAPTSSGSGSFNSAGDYTIEIPYPSSSEWGTPSADGFGTYESHVTLWMSEPCPDKDWDHWFKAPYAADVAIDKSAPAEVMVGDTFDYTLTVVNNGPFNVNDKPNDDGQLTVTDVLPDGVSFVSVATAGCAFADDTLSCDLGALPYQASKVVTFTVKAEEAGTVVNTGHVSTARPGDPNQNNNQASATTTIKGLPVARLNLTSMCSDEPDEQRRWRVRNPNDFEVEVRWEVYGTSQTGSYMAAPGDTFFMTDTVGGPNTTKIYWLNEDGVEKSKTKASGGADCNPEPECTDPDPFRDLKHADSYITGYDENAAYGVIVNRSEACPYEVGMASYKKLDDIIDHQILHAYNDTVIEPGQTLEISVPLPACAVQVDLYIGKHLSNLDGQRYGVRLLDARHLGGNNYCPSDDAPERECPIADMSVNASSIDDLTYVTATFDGMEATHVSYALGAINWTEYSAPFIFNGDGGWDAQGYEGPTTMTVNSHYGYLTCETETIDLSEILTVNQPPVAVANAQDVTIRAETRSGMTSINLDGSDSYDVDGEIVDYAWSGSFGTASGASASVGLSIGEHQITLIVTDDGGLTDSTSIMVTVEAPPVNQAPIANAGTGSTVKAPATTRSAILTLDGSGSVDNDGFIAAFTWTENGAVIANGMTPTVELGLGVHTITLTVTDDDGATATANVTITVEVDEPNKLPIADAGANQQLILPEGASTVSVTLDASQSWDPDGTIVSYAWSVGATGVNPTVELGVGVHTITLTVTDNQGSTATATVQIAILGLEQGPGEGGPGDENRPGDPDPSIES